MEIKVHARNIDDKLRVALYAMTSFAMAELIPSERLRNNISINVHLKHHEEDGEAMLEEYANRYRPRDFKIKLDHHRMEKDDYNRALEDTEWGHRVLRTLAHELVHVKQYIRGELSWRDAGLLWKGVNHNPKNLLHYYDLPYEIEALGREYGLLFGFLLVWTGLEKKFEKELNKLV